MIRIPIPSRSRRLVSVARRLILGASVVLLFASPALMAADRPIDHKRFKPEVSPAAEKFLQKIQVAKREILLGEPGLTEGVVDKIMEHRAAGKKFENLLEFEKYTGISNADLELAMKPYRKAEQARRLEAARKPVPDPPAAGRNPRRVPMEVAEPTTPNQKGPIGDVRPGFYAKLPGYEDIEKLDPVLRKEFLERVNREMCSCGCHDETLAFCLVNDPGCPVVKAQVRKIYEDITTKPPR